ncbi:hypothetical protein GJ496_000074 [Pomphorhynchus laevis]|nr:hypothetical protein GJ496_000074 [Pomphorhynchus laevis]
MPRGKPAMSQRCCNCNGQAAVRKYCRCDKGTVSCLDCLAPNCKNRPIALVPVITDCTEIRLTIADDHFVQVVDPFNLRIPNSEVEDNGYIIQNTKE